MLLDFRDNLNGLVKILLIGIIVIPFALFGVNTIFFSGSSVEKVAEVNGHAITRLRLDQAVQRQKQRIIGELGNVDPALIDEEKLRAPVLDNLIGKEVLLQNARKNMMAIAQRSVLEIISDVGQFKTNGNFDPERYRYVLSQQGFTPASYNAFLSEELLTEHLYRGLVGSVFITPSELEQRVKLANESRDFYYMRLPIADARDMLEVNQKQLNDYYLTHKDAFTTQEQVVIEYIELSPKDLEDSVQVTKSELNDYFTAQKASETESHHLAHIQLDAADADKLKEVQELLAEGKDFAELAKQYSIDLGSAGNGGDLGYVTQGMLPEEFEKAIELLEPGQVSEPVTADDGVHLIKLIDVVHTGATTFEEARNRLLADLKRQKSQELFASRLESLRDLSYNAETLQYPADELGLTLKVSKPFSHKGGEGVTAFPAVINAAFSEDVLDNGYASELLEIGEDHVLVLKLKEHLTPQLIPFEEVASDIENRLKKELSVGVLAERGANLLSRITAGETVEEVAKSEDLEWQVALDVRRNNKNYADEILRKAFSLRLAGEGPASDGFFSSNGDYLIIQVTEVNPGDSNELGDDERRALSNELASQMAARQFNGYLEFSLAHSDIEHKLK